MCKIRRCLWGLLNLNVFIWLSFSACCYMLYKKEFHFQTIQRQPWSICRHLRYRASKCVSRAVDPVSKVLNSLDFSQGNLSACCPPWAWLGHLQPETLFSELPCRKIRLFFPSKKWSFFNISHWVGMFLHKYWLPEVVKFNHLLFLMNMSSDSYRPRGFWAPPSSGCGGNTTWQLLPWLTGSTGSAAKWGSSLCFSRICFRGRPI